MNNLFLTLTQYGQPWKVVETRKFNAEELAMTTSAEVVESEYGLSARIELTNGNCTFIPLANDAAAAFGDKIDLSTADVITLHRNDEEIVRLRC